MSTLKAHDQQVSVLHIGKYFPPDPGGMETYLHDLMVSSLPGHAIYCAGAPIPTRRHLDSSAIPSLGI